MFHISTGSAVRMKKLRYNANLYASQSEDDNFWSGITFWSTIIILLFIFFFMGIFYFLLYDPCGSYKMMNLICHQYNQLQATGSLCQSLCVERSLWFHSCKYIGNRKVFLGDDLIYVVDGYLNPDDDNEIDLTEGQTLSELSNSIIDYLKPYLGAADYLQIRKKIIEFMDFNSDDQISLLEARNTVDLIQSPEFYRLLFFENHSMPKINGTCGKMFAYEDPHIYEIFNHPKHMFLSLFTANSRRYFFPSWKKRAKISVGMLEFADSLLETVGAKFVVCNFNVNTVGHTADYEFFLRNISAVLPLTFVQLKLQEKSCKQDSDCYLSELCLSKCDQNLKRCSSDLLQPSMAHVCDILSEYLVFDAPKDIRGQLNLLLERCRYITTEKEEEHSLLLFNIRSLLWAVIK